MPVFVALYGLTSLNPIYISNFALLAGGIAALACRPDLWWRMVVGAGIFLMLYFIYFASLITMHPDYVRAVWNLSALSGVLIVGIPLEELFFAVALGWMWSSVYEHFAWAQEIDVRAVRARDHGGP